MEEKCGQVEVKGEVRYQLSPWTEWQCFSARTANRRAVEAINLYRKPTADGCVDVQLALLLRCFGMGDAKK